MNDEDTYDESKEDTYLSMLKEFFTGKMRLAAIVIWAHFYFYMVLAVISCILFFKAGQTKGQIMYAALFVCSIPLCYTIKFFAWHVMQQNKFTREIKRLELRIAELNEIVKNK